MNFFGHAAVAHRIDDDPAFVLGAMAPDLLPLCGAVSAGATSPRVVDGQAHHVAVDAVFHSSSTFTSLQAWAARSLIDRGLPRGAARGAAHVGIELFLDGELAIEAGARRTYARSLERAETTQAPFVWRDEPSSARWRAMIVRLRQGAIPDAYREPEFVAARLIGALGRRPRLALDEEGARLLRAFLPSLKARVAAEADALTAPLFATS